MQLAGFVINLLPLVLFLLSIYVMYHAAKYWSVCRLRYERSFSSEGVFEGGEVFLTERIFNNSPLPVLFVDVNFHIYRDLKLTNYMFRSGAFMQPVVSRFHLLPYMEVTRTHRIICEHRGYYKLESASVYVKELRTDLRSPAKLYVYPRLLDTGITPNPIVLLQGNAMSRRRIITDPFSFSGFRDYAPGDPFNMINFKATARGGMQKIMVNRFDHSSGRILMVFLNFQTAPGYIKPKGYEDTMERALSLSASLIYEALKDGYMAGLSANCRTFSGERSINFPPVSGSYNMEDILRMLAQARISEGMSFPILLTEGISQELREAEIFIISVYADSEMDSAMRWLARRGNAVNLINPDDYEYEYEQRQADV